jgi:hypothetical protein
VSSARAAASRAQYTVYQAHIDHLHHVLQDDRLDDHTLAWNDLDHLFEHQPIDSLVNRRSAQSQQGGDRCFIDAFTRLELAGDDPVFDRLIGRVAQ